MRFGAASALVALGALVASGPPAAAGDRRRDESPVILEVGKDAARDPASRSFPDVASALASIVDASAARPYIVRIAPGVHAIPTGGIALKPFVSLEGSGAETTVLEGAVAAGFPLWQRPLTADQPAAVRMASDSRLLRLTVRNRSAEGGIAIYFPMTANAGAEEVAAEAFGRMATQGQYDYHAIRVQGPGADVTLDRVTARYRMEVPPDTPLVGDNVAIAIFGAGKLVVKNSRASAENGWWNIGVAAEAGSECTVLDSVIEVRGRAEGAFGFSAQGGRAELRNTTLAVTCPEDNSWGCAAVYGCEGPVSIHASDLRVVAGARTHQARLLSCTGTISGSRLTGPEIYDSWKLIGCTDGDSRPIPDRP